MRTMAWPAPVTVSTAVCITRQPNICWQIVTMSPRSSPKSSSRCLSVPRLCVCFVLILQMSLIEKGTTADKHRRCDQLRQRPHTVAAVQGTYKGMGMKQRSAVCSAECALEKLLEDVVAEGVCDELPGCREHLAMNHGNKLLPRKRAPLLQLRLRLRLRLLLFDGLLGWVRCACCFTANSVIRSCRSCRSRFFVRLRSSSRIFLGLLDQPLDQPRTVLIHRVLHIPPYECVGIWTLMKFAPACKLPGSPPTAFRARTSQLGSAPVATAPPVHVHLLLLPTPGAATTPTSPPTTYGLVDITMSRRLVMLGGSTTHALHIHKEGPTV